MLAAVAAAQSGDEVVLLEKNEKLGKKIFITGKGRCNVTNACDKDSFFEHVVSNPKFLYSAYSAFDNRSLMKLIEENGTALKTERGERVFPVSDHSYDIIDALKNAVKKAGAKIRLNTCVSDIITRKYEETDSKENTGGEGKKKESGKYTSKIVGVKLSTGEMILADKVILATGGISYPSTGSTGDGHRFAERTGHKIVPLKPALVPMDTKEDWVRGLQGLSLKNVRLSLYADGKCLFSEQGEMLFTHFGISGPLVLTASSMLAKEDAYKKCEAVIDLKPALSEKEFDERLIRELNEGNRKEFKNILKNIYPLKLAAEVCNITGIDPYKKCNEINKEERRKLLSFTKNMRITVLGTRDFNEAIITHGGVSVKDINPKTMESRKVKGLYFAGELLDVDAFTGGFNLQIAFSTGFLAGRSADA